MANGISNEQLRDAFLLMSSRVTYASDRQQEAVEFTIRDYFTTPVVEPEPEPEPEPIPAEVQHHTDADALFSGGTNARFKVGSPSDGGVKSE